MNSNNKYLNLALEVFLLAAFFSCSFMLPVSLDSTLKGDGQGFQVLAKNISSYGVYSLSETPVLTPTVYREPAYPYFLALLIRIGHGSLEFVKLAQMSILYFAALLAAMIAGKFMGRIAAFLTRVIILFYPTLLDYSRFTLSEILALFLFSLFAYSLVIAYQGKAWYKSAACGLILGVLILCKMVMQYFPVFLLASTIIMSPKKRTIGRAFLILVASYIVILPWMFRTHRITGEWQVSSGRQGVAIFARAYKVTYDWAEIKKEFIFNFSENLGRKLFPQVTDDLKRETFTLRVFDQINPYVISLREKGLNEKQLNTVLINDSLRLILLRPFKFIVLSGLEFEKLLAFNHFPSNSSNLNSNKDIKDEGYVRLFRYAYRVLGYFMFAAAIWALWLSRMDRNVFPLAAIIFYVVFFHSLVFGEGRFIVPIIPLIIFFDILFFKLIWSKGAVNNTSSGGLF